MVTHPGCMGLVVASGHVPAGARALHRRRSGGAPRRAVGRRSGHARDGRTRGDAHDDPADAVRPRRWRARHAARARRPRQSPLARDRRRRHDRGDRDLQRARRLHLAGVVRGEAPDRQGRPNLELHDGRRPRPADAPPRARLAHSRTSGGSSSATRRAGTNRGASTTRRPTSSRCRRRRSSGSSCGSSGSTPSASSPRTGARPTSTGSSRRSPAGRHAIRPSRPRCAVSRPAARRGPPGA